MRRARTIVAIYMRGSGIGQCANVHLPSIGGDLVPENTVFVQVRGFKTCRSVSDPESRCPLSLMVTACRVKG
jgi:hypothetical protein